MFKNNPFSKEAAEKSRAAFGADVREAMRRADADIQPDAPAMPVTTGRPAIAAPVSNYRPADTAPATYAEATADVIKRSLENYTAEMARIDADIAKLQADRENIRKAIAALSAANDMIVSDLMEAELSGELADLDSPAAQTNDPDGGEE